MRFCSRFFTTLIFATNQTLNATNAKITYLCNRFGLIGAAFLRNTAKPLFFLIPFIVSVFNAHRKKRVKCSVIRRATETGAHRFLFLCFIYQLFTYHVKRWRGLFGARCGLLSPWYVSSTTHRLSFFYMRTGTYYGLLKIAVIFTTSPKWHCKSTNIFGNHQTKNQKSLFI